MSFERKALFNQELKQDPTVRPTANEFLPSGRRTFKPYQSRYLGVVSDRNDSVLVVDCSSSEAIKKTCILEHKNLIALGSLHHSETLLTVSTSGIKFWDKQCLAEDKPQKPSSEFAFETEFVCAALQLKDNYERAQVHILPNDQSIIIVKRNSPDIMLINLAEKKSEILKTDFYISDSVFVEPHYLALGHGDEISLYNVLEKDFIKNPPLIKLDVPNFGNLIVWPGGHLWAVGQYDDKVGYWRYSIYEFDSHQSLKLVRKLPDIIESGVATRPVIVGGNFCFCPHGDSRPSKLKFYNPQTGKMRKADFAKGIHHIFSTIRGLYVQCWNDKQMQFFPLEQPAPIIPYAELKDSILSNTSLSPDTANMVAKYVGYSLEFFAPAVPPQLDTRSEVIEGLCDYINKFAHKRRLQEIQPELQKLLSSVSRKSDRSYTDLINDCPTLKKLAEGRRAGTLFIFDSDVMDLSVFLIMLQNLDEPVSEFQFVSPRL